MATYKIRHYEKLVGFFYVEADSEDEAIDVFDRKCSAGEVDFSDLELIDSEDTASLFDPEDYRKEK